MTIPLRRHHLCRTSVAALAMTWIVTPGLHGRTSDGAEDGIARSAPADDLEAFDAAQVCADSRARSC